MKLQVVENGIVMDMYDKMQEFMNSFRSIVEQSLPAVEVLRNVKRIFEECSSTKGAVIDGARRELKQLEVVKDMVKDLKSCGVDCDDKHLQQEVESCERVISEATDEINNAKNHVSIVMSELKDTDKECDRLMNKCKSILRFYDAVHSYEYFGNHVRKHTNKYDDHDYSRSILEDGVRNLDDFIIDFEEYSGIDLQCTYNGVVSDVGNKIRESLNRAKTIKESGVQIVDEYFSALSAKSVSRVKDSIDKLKSIA